MGQKPPGESCPCKSFDQWNCFEPIRLNQLQTACAYPINLCNSLGLGLSDLHHCVGCSKGPWLESVINFPFLSVALSWRPSLFPLGDSDIRHNNIKSLPNMWFANLFFIPWVAFTFIDGFFYYAESFEFDVVSLVYFCSSCLYFWWLTCLSCLYFRKWSFISCFICYYHLPFLPEVTDWLNGYKNKTHIYAVYKRPCLLQS